jgi:hypothetical protein
MVPRESAVEGVTGSHTVFTLPEFTLKAILNNFYVSLPAPFPSIALFG